MKKALFVFAALVCDLWCVSHAEPQLPPIPCGSVENQLQDNFGRLRACQTPDGPQLLDPNDLPPCPSTLVLYTVTSPKTYRYCLITLPAIAGGPGCETPAFDGASSEAFCLRLAGVTKPVAESE
jgi:hypothetical protein